MKQIFENLSDQVRTELKSLRPRKRFEGSFGKCCKGKRQFMVKQKHCLRNTFEALNLLVSLENTKEMSTKNSSN